MFTWVVKMCLNPEFYFHFFEIKIKITFQKVDVIASSFYYQKCIMSSCCCQDGAAVEHDDVTVEKYFTKKFVVGID